MYKQLLIFPTTFYFKPNIPSTERCNTFTLQAHIPSLQNNTTLPTYRSNAHQISKHMLNKAPVLRISTDARIVYNWKWAHFSARADSDSARAHTDRQSTCRAKAQHLFARAYLKGCIIVVHELILLGNLKLQSQNNQSRDFEISISMMRSNIFENPSSFLKI